MREHIEKAARGDMARGGASQMRLPEGLAARYWIAREPRMRLG